MTPAAIAREDATLNSAWSAFIIHLPTFVVTFLALIGINLISYIVGFLIYAVFSQVDPNLGAFITIAGVMPFAVLNSLICALFAAIPAIYYAQGDVVTVSTAFAQLFSRPWRYIFAGILFSVATLFGYILCIVPGIAVILTMPVYINKIFTTDMPILDAFSSSFAAIYKSENGWSFIGVQILAVVSIFVLSICTCGLGGIVAIPVATFYIQNIGYNKGVIS